VACVVSLTSPIIVTHAGLYLVQLDLISGIPHLLQVDWPDHEAGVPCWPNYSMTGNTINQVRLFPRNIRQRSTYSHDTTRHVTQLLSFQGHPYPFTKDEELCRKLLSLKHLSAERYAHDTHNTHDTHRSPCPPQTTCRRYQLSLLREPREPGRSAPTPSFESW